MQSVSTALAETLEQDVSLEIYSRVLAEWELNGFFSNEVTGSASSNDEFFPKDVVAFPLRAIRAGIPKLIVGQGRVTDDDTRPKYRVASEDSNFKYYHSAETTNSNNVFTTPVELTVTYDEPVPCNKFVLGFENSFATPTTVEVLVTYNNVDWVTTGLHNVNADGRINLWLQSDDSWGELITMYEENHVLIRGWRVVVSEMNRPNVGVSIVQVCPRLTLDLSNRVIDVGIEKVGEGHNLSNPIGSAVAATADINFANDDRFFDKENTSSVIHNLIDRNTVFFVSDIIVRNDGNAEGVEQGVFFADDWSVGSDGQASVSATDRSKYMQEAIVENSFYWNKTAEYVVRDILDRFGYPNYSVLYAPEDAQRRIPYVFFNDNETVWDALTSLAQAEQASFYFDEQDVFVWKSRDYVWLNTDPHWTIRNEADGLNLANLVDWNPIFEVTANKVNINHTRLAPATSGGEVVNNVVWEQSDTLVLNASPLTTNVTAGGATLRVVPDDFQFWPNEGILNVDGEFMRYQKSTINAGVFSLKERGLYGSTIKAHNRNPADNNWRFRVARQVNASTMEKIWSNSQYGRHVVRNSYVELSTPGGQSYWNTGHYYCGELSNSYAYYGAELVFPVSTGPLGEPYYDGEGVAGIMIHNDGNWDGYYFELLTSQFAVGNDHRKTEVRAWRRNGTTKRFLGSSSDASQDAYPEQGRFFDILPGERYRIEVLYRNISGQNQFNVFVNGQSVLSFADTAAGTKRTSGYWGVFCRAKTNVRFDAAWAVSSPLGNDDVLTLFSSLRDRITGGFNSGLLEGLWSKMNRPYADIIFEDFGPIVHGGVEFDVNYEIAPNTATDLFVSNDQESFVVFHDRDPFRSKFAIVNKSREDAVIVGSDPSKDNQSMSLFIYGRPIVEEDERSVSREDVMSRRRRGLEEFELSSPWVQTKERAERIADWLVERWGRSNDIVEAEVTLVPQLQVGDLVEVNAPSENLYTNTHQYNIVGISKSVGSTHNMSLTLRRRR